jgi:CRP-like cAMP-binding protein
MSGLYLRRPRDTAAVLAEDGELAAAVEASRREAAARASLARVLSVERGTWDARGAARDTAGGHGLLVLGGLLVRQIGIEGRIAAEPLGPGDLVLPLEHDGQAATIPFEAHWRVLHPLRLAVLDRRWSLRMAQFPDVGIALTVRALLRSRRLANMFVIATYPHLDDRLRLLLWELADRFGTVRPDGVHVPIQMTHEILSELAAARRPSVSAALSRLAASGLVVRTPDGWLLRGDPPRFEAMAESAATGPS